MRGGLRIGRCEPPGGATAMERPREAGGFRFGETPSAPASALKSHRASEKCGREVERALTPPESERDKECVPRSAARVRHSQASSNAEGEKRCGSVSERHFRSTSAFAGKSCIPSLIV
jgi:hypothetical protein